MLFVSPPRAVSARSGFCMAGVPSRAARYAALSLVSIATLIFSIPPNADAGGLLSIFGSSVAKGYGSSGETNTPQMFVNGSFSNSYGAYLTWLMSSNGWVVTNQSIPGDTTLKLIARYYRDEVPVHANEDFIGLSLGNEGLPGATNPQAIYDQFFTGITNLIAMSRSNGLIPLVGGQYPRNAYTSNEYYLLKQMDLQLNTLDVPIVNFLGATDNGQGHWGNLAANDIWHPNDLGFYEMFLSIVPSVFDALKAGKPTPHWSGNQHSLKILGDPAQPAPLSFTPATLVHSFSVFFRVRSPGTGTIASITLPASTNSVTHPTLEITSTGLVYNTSSGISTNLNASVTTWREVVLTHQYNRGLTWVYIDGALAGTASERLAPVGFVLGGPGNAVSRPPSPAQADYQNWFVWRSMLNAEEVQAQHQGAFQQASLEVYAPLDDQLFAVGGRAANRAQSTSVVAVNSSTLFSEPLPSVKASPAGFKLLFPGNSGATYQIQRSDQPSFDTYVVLAVLPAAADGSVYFIDTSPPATSAFYRCWQQ